MAASNQPPAKPLSLDIRLAETDDLTACMSLDGSYQTDYVWQMSLRESDRSWRIVFDQIRLPRTMNVSDTYLFPQRHLFFEQADFCLVASRDEAIVACANAEIDESLADMWLTYLVVQPDVRRRGAGKQLISALRMLAEQTSCRRLKLRVQTKNYPAIVFFQKLGFVPCGYDDQYFTNGDIALIFALGL